MADKVILAAVFWFAFLSLLSAVGSRKSALLMIRRIGINSRFYPGGFWKSARWMRKRYGFREKMIPWFSCCELLASDLFWLLCPVNLIVFFLLGASRQVFGILLMIHMGLAVLLSAVSAVGYLLYRRGGS